MAAAETLRALKVKHCPSRSCASCAPPAAAPRTWRCQCRARRPRQSEIRARTGRARGRPAPHLRRQGPGRRADARGHSRNKGRQTFHLVVPPAAPAGAAARGPRRVAGGPRRRPAPATPWPATRRRRAAARDHNNRRRSPSRPQPGRRGPAQLGHLQGTRRQFVEGGEARASQPPVQQRPEPQPTSGTTSGTTSFWMDLMLKLLAGVALLVRCLSRARRGRRRGDRCLCCPNGPSYALWELFSSSRPRRRSPLGTGPVRG